LVRIDKMPAHAWLRCGERICRESDLRPRSINSGFSCTPQRQAAVHQVNEPVHAELGPAAATRQIVERRQHRGCDLRKSA